MAREVIIKVRTDAYFGEIKQLMLENFQDFDLIDGQNSYNHSKMGDVQ